MNANPPATILVVDDELKAQTLLRTLLEAEGYRVLCAGNGPDALASAAQRPDVILLDIMMPGMDGYEVCTRLRADPALAAVPVIMLTALDDRASKLRGLQCGADDFLGKPFDSAELRARMRTITRLNRYRRLYEEQARFEAAIAHAPEAIVLAEADGTIIHRNAAFNALFAPAAPSPVNFFACLADDFAASVQAGTAGGTGRAPAREGRLLHGRAATTTVEITHGLVPWEGRNVIQFHLRDLTERRSLEAQLLRSQRIELLGQLAGSVVHDMNNVLTAVGGSASLLEMGTATPAVHLQNIQKGVQRGGAMMRQLLMFARGSDGEFETGGMAATICEVTDLVRETFGRAYQVSFSATDGLPPVATDPTQIHQVVMNLCVNARDAMPAGGRLDLTVRARAVDAATAAAAGPEVRPGDYVTVGVRDSGTGIPPEILPKLFDPFFTTKPEGKGTGLGLATVMRVMRRHRGFVTIDTELGKGTCFTCHFPVATAGVAPTAPLAAVT
jgi:signal transduction histidine kinase